MMIQSWKSSLKSPPPCQLYRQLSFGSRCPLMWSLVALGTIYLDQLCPRFLCLVISQEVTLLPSHINVTNATSQRDMSVLNVSRIKDIETRLFLLSTNLLNSSSGEEIDFLSQDYEDNANSSLYEDNVSLAILDFWPWQFILIVLYTFTALLSLTLNIITICVWLKSEHSISTELWKFLVNLSVADIGMAIFCIPFTYTNVMLQQWIFPHSLCPVVNFAQLCFVFVSVWTLTIIGIDRYFAIVHPLYLLHWIRSHKQSIIITIWLCGIIFASTQLFVSRTIGYIRFGKFLYECTEDWSDDFYGQIFTIVIFVLTFAGPVIIIIFVYATISYHIISHVTPGNPDSFRDRQQWSRKIKVLKMLITIVSLFALCWFPIHLFNLLVYFVPEILRIRSRFTYALFYASFFFSHFLSMAHSLVNPIVYCFMSENFRLNLWHMMNRYLTRIKSCDTVNTMVGEHIELDVQLAMESQDQTLTSYNFRTRKTLTKISAIQADGNKNAYQVANHQHQHLHQPNNHQLQHQHANYHQHRYHHHHHHHQNHLHCHPCSNFRMVSSGSSTNSNQSLPNVHYFG